VFLHRFEERECAAEVVAVVHERFADALGYRFIACKVDNDLDVIFREYFLHIRFIAHIRFIEPEILAAYLFYKFDSLGLRVVEVVHYDDILVRFQKFDAGVGADISRSAGD